MHKFFCIVSLTLILTSNVSGQHNIEVRGKIKDSSGMPLSNATIVLRSLTDSLIQKSSNDGSFDFHFASSLSFSIVITMEGLKRYSNKFFVDPQSNYLNLPDIILQQNFRELEPVIVLRYKPVIIKDDTVNFQARAFNIATGSALEKLLKKLPGTEVTLDEAVLVGGKKIGRVLVNGQEFFNGDVTTAIQNIPVDLIDIVQVFDDYGDKAKLTGVKNGESVKVLNIILKKENKDGAFGEFKLGTGTKDKYDNSLIADILKNNKQFNFSSWFRNISPAGNDYESGVYGSFAGALGKKLNASISSGYSNEKNRLSSLSLRDDYLATSKNHFEDRSETAGNNQNLGIGATVIFTLGRCTTLKLSPSFSFIENSVNSSSSSRSLIYDSINAKTIITNSQSHSLSDFKDAGANIYFEGKSPRSGNRYTAEMIVRHNTKLQHLENISSSLITLNDSVNSETPHNLLHDDTKENNASFSFNYYMPTSKQAFIEFGYSGNYSANNNKHSTWSQPVADSPAFLIDSLSNSFMYKMSVQHAHVGYIMHNPKTNFTISAALQQILMWGQNLQKSGKNNYSFLNFLPNVEFAYAITQKNKIVFGFSSTVTPPGLKQLQPITDFSNPQFPITGNPNLAPTSSNVFKAQFDHVSFKPKSLQVLNIGINFISSRNMILQDIIHPKDLSNIAQKAIWQNANGFHAMIIEYFLKLPALCKQKLNISFGGFANIAHTPSLSDSIQYFTKSLNWKQSININLLASDNFESEVSFYYSHLHSRYTSNSEEPISKSAGWALSSRHYFKHGWEFTYSASQVLTSENGSSLQANPIIVNSSFEKQILKYNRASIKASCKDIFNTNDSFMQTVSATSVSKTNTDLVGRYFEISFILRMQIFK